MKSRSSTTPCSRVCLLAASVLAVAGCSVKPLPPAADQALPPFISPEPEKPTILTLEYGNRSSKASIQIDLSGTDVQLEMTGSRDSIRKQPSAAASTAAQAPPTAQPVVVNVSQNPSRPVAEDSGSLRVRRIVDSASPKGDQGISDSTLRKVVQRIRKSQELFYAGRYPEAEDQVRRANELKPTAEGLALAGSIAWVRKDKEGARRKWLEARELDPDFPGLSAVLESEPARQDPSR